MTHIPYRGLAGAMNDVLGGRLDFVFSSIPSLGGTVADGKVRLLAAAGTKRLKAYPDIPSMAELGHPEVDVDLWFGLVAPAGTDDGDGAQAQRDFRQGHQRARTDRAVQATRRRNRHRHAGGVQAGA